MNDSCLSDRIERTSDALSLFLGELATPVQ
jgi:hypothetical protein